MRLKLKYMNTENIPKIKMHKSFASIIFFIVLWVLYGYEHLKFNLYMQVCVLINELMKTCKI